MARAFATSVVMFAAGELVVLGVGEAFVFGDAEAIGLGVGDADFLVAPLAANGRQQAKAAVPAWRGGVLFSLRETKPGGGRLRFRAKSSVFLPRGASHRIASGPFSVHTA